MRIQRTKYTYVNHWNDIYRLTRTQWLAYLRAVAASDNVSPASYGHYVHSIHYSILELTPEKATTLLTTLAVQTTKPHEPKQA